MAPVMLRAGPRVSVALPVCNNERFIAAAVRSILNQTLPPDEIVIGDDGSSDGTSAILAGLARENPAIRLLRREEKSGLANAANWVVNNTANELVMLAHADDLSHPDRLVRQVAALNAEPAAVLVGAPATGIDEGGRRVHAANLWRLVRPTVFAPFAHSSIMFRRQAFVAVGGYRVEADYWEDLDLFWRMARAGRLAVLTDAVTSYRYSHDSARTRDRSADVERAVERMYVRADVLAAGQSGLPGAAGQAGRVRPRVFIARSWVAVWRAQPPRMWKRLLRHGRLRLDRESLVAILFVGGATLAPRPFRTMLRAATAVRNGVARLMLGGRGPVEWCPHRSGLDVRDRSSPACPAP